MRIFFNEGVIFSLVPENEVTGQLEEVLCWSISTGLGKIFFGPLLSMKPDREGRIRRVHGASTGTASH